MIRRLLFGLLLTLVLLIVAGIALVASALQPTPLVTPPSVASPQQVQAARAVAKRTLQVVQRAQPARIRIQRHELDALPSLVSRAYPRLSTRLNPSPAGVELAATLELPQSPLDRYLSVSAHIPAGREFAIEQLQIGNLQLPDSLIDWLLPIGLERLLGPEQRDLLLNGLQIVDASDHQLSLLLTPPSDPKQQLSALVQSVRDLGGSESQLDPALISHYYQQLLDIAAELNQQQWVSVTHFIAPLFREVSTRIGSNDAHQHNRAAIMALALYLGSHQFEQFTGPVLLESMRQQRPHQRTLLRGRADLRLHFIYSAAIQVMGEEGLSYAMGEFKELLDSNRGGSGFSFADLAADRAGTLFATRATADARQAQAFLERFEQPLREADLMIPIDRLPEGLTAPQFSDAYQDIGGPRYRALVEKIDQQLLALRLYRPIP